MSSTTCSLILPSISAWQMALALHLGLQVFALTSLGLLLYSLPYRARKPVGVVLGLIAAVIPLILVNVVYREGVNWMVSFVLSVFGFSSFFKSMSVAFDSYPDGADKNLQTWLLWFTSLPEPAFAKGKPIRVQRSSELVQRASLLLLKIIWVGVIVSILLMNEKPYERENNNATVARVFYSMFHLWLIYLFVSLCLDVGALVVMLLGFTTEPPFSNPLFTSRSYKEVWGTKWNRPVHLFLKRTVYVPIRKVGMSPTMAVVITFCSSGLLHEYISSITRAHQAGRAMIFFLLVGLLMLTEDTILNKLPHGCRRIIDSMPTVIVAICLQLPVLPFFENLFWKSCLESGMLESLSELMPHLACHQ